MPESAAEYDLRALDRIAKRLEITDDGCWLWTGFTEQGYARFAMRGRSARVHRWLYEYTVEPVGDLDLDHLCRRTHCVNPDHLEPVSHAENVRRGFSPTAINGRKTHCKNGHPLTGENIVVYTNPSTGPGRYCLVCRREYKAALQAAITHCVNGHPFSGENLLLDRRGRRRCKTCMRNNAPGRRAERKAAA